MNRPLPPAALIEASGPLFAPAPDVLEWITATFIEESGPLHNPDHAHLVAAKLGILWTNVPSSRQGRGIVGQCEFKPPGGTMGKWARARAEAQLTGWFGEIPDFLITLFAPYAAAASDAAFCALAEHELYHAGQANDSFGMPKFHRDSGLPVFALRGHDVEEFVGVVRRYGITDTSVAELVAAAGQVPELGADVLRGVCGTCAA